MKSFLFEIEQKFPNLIDLTLIGNPSYNGNTSSTEQNETNSNETSNRESNETFSDYRIVVLQVLPFLKVLDEIEVLEAVSYSFIYVI